VSLCWFPMGYGWGYRGWALPIPGTFSVVAANKQLPQVLQRRLTTMLGMGGDYVWGVFIIGILWAILIAQCSL